MRARNVLPDVDVLRKLFHYDKLTGVITRIRDGKRAGSKNKNGYVCISFNLQGVRIYVQAHRLAYKLVTGEEPENVDHRYGVAAGDAWFNLRAADSGGNSCNKRVKDRYLPRNVHVHGKKIIVIVRRGPVRHVARGFPSVEAANQYANAVRAKLHGEFAASRGVALDLTAKQR